LGELLAGPGQQLTRPFLQVQRRLLQSINLAYLVLMPLFLITSKDDLNPLQDRQIAISMDSKGRALDNIFVERFCRTLTYEHVYVRGYADGLSLWKGLEKCFHFYNYQRKYQSLGYQTPAQWYVNEPSGKGNSIIFSPVFSNLNQLKSCPTNWDHHRLRSMVNS
jgi:putative transposase